MTGVQTCALPISTFTGDQAVLPGLPAGAVVAWGSAGDRLFLRRPGMLSIAALVPRDAHPGRRRAQDALWYAALGETTMARRILSAGPWTCPPSWRGRLSEIQAGN